jgi:hypothetical protein
MVFESITTKEIVLELKRRQFQGVRFYNIQPGESYVIVQGNKRMMQNTGPATLFEVTKFES